MAYYEMMPAGLPAGLQSGMDSVLNKKFGTATSYAPGTWPDTVNLMGPLPEATASGSIATLEDGADAVPCKNVVATIAPNLDGVSSVTVTQTGRNLASGGVYEYNARNMIIAPVYLKAGTYTVSFNRGVNVQYIYIRKGETVSLTGDAYATKSNSTFFTFTADEDTYYYAQLYRTNTSDTWEDYPVTQPQIEYGSTAHAYEPYQTPTQYTADLGRTIYGGQADIVNGEGTETHKIYTASDVTGLYWNNHKDQQVDTNHRASFRISLPSGYITQYNSMCNALSYSTSIGSGQGSAEGYQIIPTGGIYFCIDLADIGMENATSDTPDEDFLTAIQNYGDNLKFVVELANATDFTFDGQEVNTRLGYNAFWSDSGDTEVTYRADINLALQALSGSRGLMMARPQLEPETEPEETIEETPEEMER